MKNSAGFYITSTNCAARGGESAAQVCLLARTIDLAGLSYPVGVEWHHASGNRIAFFANKDGDAEKINAFEVAVEAAVRALGDVPKSKAAAWRGLVQNDGGFGSVDYKDGKFGRFVPKFGESDGTLYYPSAAYASASRALGV